MAQYQPSRPRQDVRIRNWSKGRLANLKLLITRLESQLDQTGAASVVESAARRFDDLVPFVLDLRIDAGYRQFVVNFSEPPGLAGSHPNRQLIFYEIQHDSTPAFSDPIIIETPQRHIMIGGVGSGETRFFRARVINTKFHASRWSSTVISTTARSVFQQTPITDIATRLISPIGEWQTIFSQDYDPFNGAVCLNIQIAMAALQEDVDVLRQKDGGVAKTFQSGPAFVQFRVLKNTGTGDEEFGQRTILSARPGFTGFQVGKTPQAFGTLVTEFIRPGQPVLTFKLQAAKMVGSEWRGGTGANDPLQEGEPYIWIRNSKILEVLENL